MIGKGWTKFFGRNSSSFFLLSDSTKFVVVMEISLNLDVLA
jgi:hypothetical protein